MTNKTIDQRLSDRRDLGLARVSFGRFSTVADRCPNNDPNRTRRTPWVGFLKLTVFGVALAILLFGVAGISQELSHNVKLYMFTESDMGEGTYAVGIQIEANNGAALDNASYAALIDETLDEEFRTFESVVVITNEDANGEERTTFVALFGAPTDLRAIGQALVDALNEREAEAPTGSSNGESFTES